MTEQEQAKKTRAFDALVFRDYGQKKDYPKTLHRLRQCRRSLAEFTPTWDSIGVAKQYALAQAALIIALQTSAQDLRAFRLSPPPEEENEFQYAIDWKYQDPKTIQLTTPQKLLK